jgi:hypothetical protein
MGIAVHCPNGHGLRVKDEFAGKKVLCPTCQAATRVPLAATPAATLATAAADAGLPTAQLLTLAPAAVAQLPRASPFPAAAPAMPPAPMPTLHPVLAEMPDLEWRIAYPGGEPSEAVSAESMQAWLDARQAEGSELVWRSDWPEWIPARDVFPDQFAETDSFGR